MSIVNDVAAESIRQSRLFSQLADLSYKAVNGKRQTARDFTKGMLNVGKLGEQMDVPKDEITKDMILDYKREQEEKLYDGNKLYQSTGLPDLQEYTPLFTGDDVDVENQKRRLNIHNERRKQLIQKKNQIEKDIIEIKKKIDYFQAKPARSSEEQRIKRTYLENKTEELAKKKEDLDDTLGDIVLEENGFRVQYQRALQAKENIKANETEKIRIRDENKQLVKDYGEKFNILNRDRTSITKQPNETDEQYFQRIKDLEATTVDPNIYKDRANLEEIKKLKRNLKDILKDPSKIEDIIKSFPNPQDLYIININWKRISEFLKSKYGVNSRFTTVQEYVDELTKALENVQTGTFKTVLASQPKKPGPQGRQGERGRPGRQGREGPQGLEGEQGRDAPQNNEPSLTSTFMNPILARQAALQQDITRYREGLPSASLSLLPRDEAQQADIARVRQAEAEVQARASRAAMDAIIQREAPAIERISQVLAEGARGLPEAGTIAVPNLINAPYEFLDNNSTLYFNSNGYDIYIKIGRDARNAMHILGSTSGRENTFFSFDFRSSTSKYSFDVFLKKVGLFNENNESSELYNQVFGFYNKSDIYRGLKNITGLQVTTPLKIFNDNSNNQIIGWGLKKRKTKAKSKVIKGRGMQQIDEEGEFKEEIPKIADFGNKKILLNKLYYRNILSVKDKKGHSIEKLPNTSVSDQFVKIIMMAYYDNIKKTINKKLVENIENLEQHEQDLLNLLLFISGLNKNHNIDIKRNDNVKKLKDRLALVEAQINAGNNNIVVKKELKELVNKLYLFGAISLNSARDYIKQYK